MKAIKDIIHNDCNKLTNSIIDKRVKLILEKMVVIINFLDKSITKEVFENFIKQQDEQAEITIENVSDYHKAIVALSLTLEFEYGSQEESAKLLEHEGLQDDGKIAEFFIEGDYLEWIKSVIKDWDFPVVRTSKYNTDMMINSFLKTPIDNLNRQMELFEFEFENDIHTGIATILARAGNIANKGKAEYFALLEKDPELVRRSNQWVVQYAGFKIDDIPRYIKGAENIMKTIHGQKTFYWVIYDLLKNDGTMWYDSILQLMDKANINHKYVNIVKDVLYYINCVNLQTGKTSENRLINITDINRLDNKEPFKIELYERLRLPAGLKLPSEVEHKIDKFYVPWCNPSLIQDILSNVPPRAQSNIGRLAYFLPIALLPAEYSDKGVDIGYRLYAEISTYCGIKSKIKIINSLKVLEKVGMITLEGGKLKLTDDFSEVENILITAKTMSEQGRQNIEKRWGKKRERNN